MTTIHPLLLPAAAVALALALVSGCATKKFVRNTITPVEERVGAVDEKTAANAERIGRVESKLEKDVSRLDERTTANQEEIQETQQAVEQARRRANDAHELAADAGDRAGALEKKFADLSNYRLHTREAVLFALDKSELNEEAKGTLNALAATVSGKKDYVLEVRGFTDTTGSDDYNFALSRRRAEAVVRYLNAIGKIPLRHIHRIGLGDAAPAADNDTREGRKRNRRVEVSLYTPLVEESVRVSEL